MQLQSALGALVALVEISLETAAQTAVRLTTHQSAAAAVVHGVPALIIKMELMGDQAAALDSMLLERLTQAALALLGKAMLEATQTSLKQVVMALEAEVGQELLAQTKTGKFLVLEAMGFKTQSTVVLCIGEVEVEQERSNLDQLPGLAV
jgi:hypothetical protein